MSPFSVLSQNDETNESETNEMTKRRFAVIFKDGAHHYIGNTKTYLIQEYIRDIGTRSVP